MLSTHILSVHENEGEACAGCGKLFQINQKQTRHQATHIKFRCEKCKKVFTGADNFKQRKKQRYEAVFFVCLFCFGIFIFSLNFRYY